MSKNQSRILIGTLIGIVVLTAALLVVGVDCLTLSAYFFGPFGIIVCTCTLLILSKENSKRYIANAATSLIAFRYAVFSLSTSIIFVVLHLTEYWTVPVGYFILSQLFLAMFLIWKLLAMGSGKEEIERIENVVTLQIAQWHLLKSKMTKILNNSDNEIHEPVKALYDAVRYADPMTDDKLADCEKDICTKIEELADLVKRQKYENVKQLCSHITQLVKNRNEQCKLLK